MTKIIEVVMKIGFKCSCCNATSDPGFYPCDKEGNEIKPIDIVKGKIPWKGHYKCYECDQVYKSINF